MNGDPSELRDGFELCEAVCSAPGRLDAVAAAAFGISRSSAAAKLALGEILLDGKQCRPSQKVAPGQPLTMLSLPPRDIPLVPQNIPLQIVYQDADIVVVNKQRGLVVHPAAGNESGTLVNALMYHVKDLAGIGGELRPGIVHRIDKDTTGLLVVAKNMSAYASLARQIALREMHRVYHALVGGYPAASGIVDAPIGRCKTDRKRMAAIPDGRCAVSAYKVLESFKGFSLLEILLDTGRTHQIRVHMQHIGHPVAGDKTYGGAPLPGLHAQALHAARLSFAHPSSGETVCFEAPLPDDFAACLELLRLENKF